MTVGAGGGADMDARQDTQVRDGQRAAQGCAARGEPRRGGQARGALGRYGETLAARRLTQAGMTVLARNWRCGRTGEIDIVARDGDALVVCEVKTRRAMPFQHPMAAITPVKASRLRGLAERWLQEHGGAPPGGVRIDLVGVLLPMRGAPVVEHVKGVA
nr:YraN family protein [Streptomyces sp. DH20]